MKNHRAFCADVGSIPKGNFGWASSIDGELKTGTDIGVFATDIADAIKSECKVSIGFECPLFVPVRDEPIAVASARRGEGQRSWSAGAGTGALTTGMVQSLWVMRRVKAILGCSPKLTFDWEEFAKTNSVFLWEAFVTSDAKRKTHCQDAKVALRHFLAFAGKPGDVSAIQESNVLSLIGACAIRAGWSKDIELLWKPCLVSLKIQKQQWQIKWGFLMKINRKNLLIEKESGAYGCPNYIDPEFGKLILNVYNIKSTDEGALLFTEVIENFGLQLIKNVKKELTKEEVIKLTKNLVIV